MESQQKGFDLTVTHRDEKTGQVIRTEPYILRVIGEVGSNEKTRLWERPAGSGNLFDKKGNAVGRWVYEDKIVKGKKVRTGKFEPDVEHVEFVAPQTEDQKLRQQLTEDKAKIAELERELAAVRMEKEKKSAPIQPTQKKDQGA